MKTLLLQEWQQGNLFLLSSDGLVFCLADSDDPPSNRIELNEWDG